MLHVGNVDANFSISGQNMEVCFDPHTQQQVLSVKFALSISLSQLLQKLAVFQQDGVARGLPEAPKAIPGPAIPGPAPTRPGPGPASPVAPGQLAAKMPSKLQAPVSARIPRQEGQPMLMPPASDPGQHRGSSEVSPNGQQDTASLPMNAPLITALHENRIPEVSLAIQQQADVNCSEGAPHFRTPMHMALEAGGNIDAVNLLLMNKANVNAPMVGGKTPLHTAIQQYQTLPPVVIRMLLCAGADLMKPDQRGATPLYNAKLIALTLAHGDNNERGVMPENTRVRQLLNEVTERPTVDVVIVDTKDIKSALFADTDNDTLVFHTDSSIGLYSLKQKRTMFLKKLRGLPHMYLQSLAVNPSLGTVTVCVAIGEKKQNEATMMQNVILVWPTGQIQDEESLKLTMQRELPAGAPAVPVCVKISQSTGLQMLLARLCNGEVTSWRLNNGRSQLMSEAVLVGKGGLIAASDDGCWMAVVNKENEAEAVDIWMYENLAVMTQDPIKVTSIQRRPESLAIIENRSGSQTSCLVAVAEYAYPGQPPAPVEILLVTMDGLIEQVFRIKSQAPCYSLEFASGPPIHVVIGHVNGLIIVCNLVTGLISMSHGDPSTGCVHISADRSMLVSVEQSCMWVHKVPPPDSA